MPVACPWFEPLQKTVSTDRPAPARSPLGAVFDGLCHASGEPRQPEEELIRDVCNFGYGRNCCPRFPQNSEADAVRFSEHRGKLLWILEKEYQPLRHGVADDSNLSTILARQIYAFRTTCLNQKL
jgi:hypothetical protein